MKLAVIIVSYNVKYYLEQCLVSLLKATKGIETAVYVVDNHSRDGSAEYVKRHFPEVNVIGCIHNLGFARANNIAIRQSDSQYVLLLNPDTIVCENTIKNVLDFMDAHPDAGGAGVRMLKADGTDAMESRRGLPTPMTAFYKMCGLCNRYPRSHRFGHYYMSYLPWDKPERIEVISGAFCMLRREALDKIGLLDEDFFMYGEDIDLSFRLLKGGYTNWYIPEPILHYKGESTHKSSFRYVHVFYEAMLIFFKKHYGHLTLLISLPIKTAIYAKATAALIKIQMDGLRKSLGFFAEPESEPSYLFIGSGNAIKLFEDIARRRGLNATIINGNAQTRPEGHTTLDLSREKNVCVVYDTESYSHAQILDLFATHPAEGVTIGTFYPQTKTIITLFSIIQ